MCGAIDRFATKGTAKLAKFPAPRGWAISSGCRMQSAPLAVNFSSVPQILPSVAYAPLRQHRVQGTPFPELGVKLPVEKGVNSIAKALDRDRFRTW